MPGGRLSYDRVRRPVVSDQLRVLRDDTQWRLSGRDAVAVCSPLTTPPSRVRCWLPRRRDSRAHRADHAAPWVYR
ncbi:hypothetical protein HYQ46_000430 [Verticillium longisporum]|nr:hypothetical protein HYQ46_000430 [Verticillium longisporum]